MSTFFQNKSTGLTKSQSKCYFRPQHRNSKVNLENKHIKGTLKLKIISNMKNIVLLRIKFLIKLKLLIQFDIDTKSERNRNSGLPRDRIYIHINSLCDKNGIIIT